MMKINTISFNSVDNAKDEYDKHLSTKDKVNYFMNLIWEFNSEI